MQSHLGFCCHFINSTVADNECLYFHLFFFFLNFSKKMQVNILSALPLTHFYLETPKRVTGKQCKLIRHLAFGNRGLFYHNSLDWSISNSSVSG